MAEISFKRLLHDPTPNRVVANRFFLSQFELQKCCAFSSTERNEWDHTIHRTSLKLIAAWKASTVYSDVTERLLKEAQEPLITPEHPIGRVDFSQELHEHLDVFLTQFKSTLDHMIKLGQPVFGRKQWALRTFGDSGRKVVRSLQSVPDRFSLPASELSTFIAQNEEWIRDVIDFRDRMNHGLEGGIDPYIFSIYCKKSGDTIETYCPLFKEEPLEEWLTKMWWQLFLFVEGFIAYLLWARASLGCRLYFRPVPIDSPYSPWAIFQEGMLESIKHPAFCVGRDDGEKQ
jgi:hypothetical protein